MPQLRCIFGAGAGVDLITRDPDFPRHIPLVRMTPPGAAQRMGDYVCWAALHLLRQGRRMALAQARGEWEDFACASAPDIRVGIMGLGVMGARAAAMLQGLGFCVQGWSRSEKKLPGVADFVGDAGLGRLPGRDRPAGLSPPRHPGDGGHSRTCACLRGCRGARG